MVALLTIGDITDAIGRGPVDSAESDKWQFYIDAISAYINGYVEVSFEEIADDVVRYEADYYGLINLGGDPVSTVTAVNDFLSQSGVSYYWNGLDEILGLCPNQVVDVTYTHGYATVPDDIKFVATQAVIGVLDLGATGSITSFTVGDVTEVYSDPSKEGTTVVELQKSVLDRYSNIYGSWRLGSTYSTGNQQLPTL